MNKGKGTHGEDKGCGNDESTHSIGGGCALSLLVRSKGDEKSEAPLFDRRRRALYRAIFVRAPRGAPSLCQRSIIPPHAW